MSPLLLFPLTIVGHAARGTNSSKAASFQTFMKRAGCVEGHGKQSARGVGATWTLKKSTKMAKKKNERTERLQELPRDAQLSGLRGLKTSFTFFKCFIVELCFDAF